MKFGKAIRAGLNPCNWRGLLRGVVPSLEHAAVFQGREYRTVIDIGANRGQFSLFAANRWPGAEIIAFEPLPDQADWYQAVHGNRATLHRVALGEQRAEMTIHIASRKDSSSLLPLGEKQKKLFAMDEVGEMVVPVEKLDAVLTQETIQQPSLMKIDVQGYEYQVLYGALEILPYFTAVYVELSFVQLYEEQKLSDEVIDLLRAAGFSSVEETNTTHDEKGVKVQSDMLFERNGSFRQCAPLGRSARQKGLQES